MARHTTLVAATSAAVLTSLFVLPGLGERSLDGDEGTYAAVALESAQTSAWLPLTLHGRPFVNKPPLFLTFLRISLGFFGIDERAARLPSAVAAIGLCSLIGSWAAHGHGLFAGVLAAAVLTTTPGLLAESGWHGFRNATTDSLLALLVAMALISYRRASVTHDPGARALALGSLVAATATKGLAAALFAIPVSLARVAAPETRSKPRLRREHALDSLLVGLACLVPFLLWVALVEAWLPGQAVARLVERDLWQRAMSGLNAIQLRGPHFYFLQLARDFGWLLLFACWSVLRAARRTDGADLRRFLLLWAILPVAFATFAATKLPWYIYPTYPAWAVLVACGARDSLDLIKHRSRVLAAALVVAAAALLGARVLDARELVRAKTPSLGMQRVSTWLEAHPEAVLRVDASLRFGRGGLTGGEYFYYLKSRTSTAPVAGLETEDGCTLDLSQLPRPLLERRSRNGEAIALVSRPHPAHPQIFLIDQCGGELAAELGLLDRPVHSLLPAARTERPTSASRQERRVDHAREPRL